MKSYNKILEAVNRGIQFALDDFEADEIQPSIPKQETITKDDSLYKAVKFRDYVVDLGLPSGTLWCKYNLGCDFDLLNYDYENTIPKNWYGDYYAWGETIPNKYLESDLENAYSWETYKWAEGSYDSLTKYCTDYGHGLNDFTDNLTKLLHVDDAAYQNLHLYNYKFHIPTKEQFEELLKYTTNEWIENYNHIIGLNGMQFISKINENKLFIPAAGHYSDSDVFKVGSLGFIWSSDIYLDSPECAWHLGFYNGDIGMYDDDRFNGFSIRPILNL